MTLTRRRLATIGLGAAAAGLPQAARAAADGYPSRTISYVSPYPPGGTNDLAARILARFLSARFGQPVVVENKGGAGGTIGSDFVAKSAPDGYVLLNASSGNLTSAPQVLGAPYDPVKDFVPVGFVGHCRFVVAVHPSLPVTSLAELLDFARAHPGAINYGTAGIGTGGHIAGEYLRLHSGIDIVHIPYRGSVFALNDVVAGRIQLVLDPLAIGHVKAGRLRALTYFGASDSPDLPGVPSIQAAGFPDWEPTNFWLAAAPAGTPPGIVAALNRAFVEAAEDPAVSRALKELGVEILPLRPGQVAALLRDETEVNRRVIALAGIGAS
ncbi:Bug family tripartite tricarboxylate transporter substrate binding protein [Paracraurococcus lichenis]|uniref:Tripartite tricarboxylate transporter substrate binding protein n=1 Tax=Paracraurococcus lichenis TaxID=3064888 RepID=A0ABT9E5R5_9PROT|nr:tripartite tricarboxylate transporter substrate binding protein [Paracraurococcus sp. LOR1-02]MDO9711488.1 tripartite tricarboxylate transporter substrate binding protein [Paracraurococcus sp. LOR1-02]